MTADARDFPEVLATLEPYLADVVLIGGWVPHLYREYGNLGWQGTVSRTTEGDVLVPSTLEPNGRPKLRELLEANGLRPARKEFFPADWIASDTVATRSGPLNVRVPTLGAWAVGKALTFGARQATVSGGLGEGKRAKDLLYIRDLVFAGGRVLQQVSDDLVAIALDRAWSLTLRRAVDRLTPVAVNSAMAEVTVAANQLAIREGRSAAAAVAEIRAASRELIDIIRASLS